ncbi:MAG TPA: hypothetical protein VN875_10405 [Candidatus Binatus sp.]|nr:hypothetical protein [Candidatus Binatus sp.]
MLAERTWLAQAAISAGCIYSAPQAPNPPAFAIAVESEGALAPDIGASSTGARKENRAQRHPHDPWRGALIPPDFHKR